MRILLLTVLTLVAFAANSVLTRAALALGEIGPGMFMSIRLAGGAVTLSLLVALSGGLGDLRRYARLGPAAMLLLYMAGFSYAYVTIDTGSGALILFGGVQVTMFAGALLAGERPGPLRWLGSGLGMAGLAVLFLPGATAPDAFGALLMTGAAIGWGMYSLAGRGPGPALAKTGAAFILATGPALLIWLLLPQGPEASGFGILLAVLSGAIASGMGYAMWYAVLPKMDATVAAVAQLTVPIIALLGGMVFLMEPLTSRFVIAAALIIGGVGLALWSGKRAS